MPDPAAMAALPPSSFLPHGFCLLWQPELVALHLGSDALIALAYASTAGSVWLFTYRRKDLEHRGLGYFLGAVFAMCGVTHGLDVLSLWRPYYEAIGLFKAATAVLSGVTAVLLWSLVPKGLALPSPATLRAVNLQLEAEVNEHYKTEAELRAAISQVESASRAKSTFLAGMSHELRTPLNAIIGFSDGLQSGSFGHVCHVQCKDYMSAIHKSGVHLLKLINDILDLAKIEARKVELQEEKLDLADIISSCVGMVAERAQANAVALSATVAPLRPLLADERRLKQILLNLLSNAIKFTPKGGSVTLAVASNSETLTITITDTGIGIAADQMEKALESFGQIDSDIARTVEGTGLGLPLTKGLVELHGGTLTLTSEVGAGTVATIRLPAARLMAG